MKKKFLVVLSIVMIVITLTGCTKTKQPVLTYEDGQKDACFELGGLVNREGKCVLPEPEPEVIEKVIEVEVPIEKVVEVVITPTTSNTNLDPRCPYTVNYGKAGTFKAEWDNERQTCIIGMHEHSRLTPGMSLADIVEQGISFTFDMPFDGYINHSAEFISVNGTNCIPANPIRCGGISLIQEGDEVNVLTAAGNTSAGIFLIQVQP